MSVAFLVTALVVVATPGTGVVYTLSAALSQGRRASVVAAFGCTLGVVPHLVATVTGLAALLHASAVAFQVLKYLGVAYLLYLAWATFRDGGTVVVSEDTPPRPASGVILYGVLVNFLNPKLTMFFLAFLPQFVNTGDPGSTVRMLELSAVFMLITFAVFTVYGLFAASVRDQVVSRPRVTAWLARVFAASFVALGVRLALTDR
ncbi:LysE family translocator [Streptosporangium sandarakinum]|uniref:LysE family translocator n=1 Tax=Streptosporangium sandarakinum TaxID=1260955 RepID=UPI0033A6A0CF